jgi:hypothetical protein
MYKLLALAFAACFFAHSSFAAPRAESAQECGIAADMAMVAQSLAHEQIAPAKAGAIMARIYDVSESERGASLMKHILDTAYFRGVNSNQSFAEELLAACLQTDGDMDAVLGPRLRGDDVSS